MANKITKEQTEELKKLWKNLCDKNYAEIGDSGSCVLGAGLTQDGEMIISANEVSPCQGSIVWEKGLTNLLKEFNEKYDLEIRHEWGNMD